MAGRTDSPITVARARADAELKKALSGLNLDDFSTSTSAFYVFIDRVKDLFNEEAAELVRTRTEFATFKRDVLGLREQIMDEYTKAPPRRKMTKRERRRLERPMPIDERLSVVPIDRWDLFAPMTLLPNKKYGVREELKRVLGDQLSYWLREAARQFDGQRPAADHRPSNEADIAESIATETKKSTPVAGDGAVVRRPGRKPDAGVNRRIAGIVEPFGSNWRDHLADICEALDKDKVPLPRSKKWTTKGCADWTDVLGDDQEGLVKALQHRLDWVAQHPADDPAAN